MAVPNRNRRNDLRNPRNYRRRCSRHGSRHLPSHGLVKPCDATYSPNSIHEGLSLNPNQSFAIGPGRPTSGRTTKVASCTINGVRCANNASLNTRTSLFGTWGNAMLDFSHIPTAAKFSSQINEGYTACLYCIPRERVPYFPNDSEPAQAWLHGWNTAAMQIKGKR